MTCLKLLKLNHKFVNKFAIDTHLVSPPIITKQPTDKLAGVYSTITFECKVQGYGYINVTWTKHESAFLKASIVKNNKLINGVSSTLTITNTAAYYGGMYCCVATNKGGQATSEHAKLSVQGM